MTRQRRDMSPADQEERIAQLALRSIPKVGPVIGKRLIDLYGSARAVFASSTGQLASIRGVGKSIANRIMRPESLQSGRDEFLRLESVGARVHFYTDASYPDRLKHIYQSPVLITGLGSVNLNHPRMIAIIGTRKPSAYGLQQCDRLVEDLAKLDVCIVSGLAYGIDIRAHRQAILHGIPTIGVMASGIGYIYPSSHRNTAKEMIKNGAVVSEFAFDTKPEKDQFPARNRIIAGLCDAVIVIESNVRGGSMITVEFANDFNREVGVLPGRVGDAKSAGCNMLIKAHKAHLVENAEDIGELLGWNRLFNDKKSNQGLIFTHLNNNERRIKALISEHGELHIDQIAAKSGLSLSELAPVLLSLECHKAIYSLPGNRYRDLENETRLSL